jgi:hypothetical protein
MAFRMHGRDKKMHFFCSQKPEENIANQEASVPIPVSAAARLLGPRVRIPPGAWMSVSFEYCVLSLRRAGHWSGGALPSVVRPYLETSMRRPRATRTVKSR